MSHKVTLLHSPKLNAYGTKDGSPTFMPRPEIIAAERRPRVADWWQRVQARPAFATAFSFKNPDANDPVKAHHGKSPYAARRR